MNHIRNFTIIAHIDHGKSTLADRMLEVTHTIEARKMKDQVLDDMELEREKGITIKMRPVRMIYDYKSKTPNHKHQISNNNQNPSSKNLELGTCDLGISDGEFILNLIDTPGHIDFSYEVSRALKAVEGSILLVDSTQGVQAQTLTTLRMAREAGLTIIPVLSKIDSPLARVDEVKDEVARILECDPSEILGASGKTGEGVPELLKQIVEKIPPPKEDLQTKSARALVFDFQYSNHKGVIVFVRVTEGSIKKGDELIFKVANEKFHCLDVGVFVPEEKTVDVLSKGEIGYIVTGIKRPGIASVGDTITLFRNPAPALFGYEKPFPVVWASVFPEDADEFENLKQALSRLRLSDSAFSFEEESSGSLGRGFRCGFLGLLHLEIITERLKREFNLSLVIATPTITYEVTEKSGKTTTIYSPSLFPEHGQIVGIKEPWVAVTVICPSQYVGNVYQLLYDHEAEMVDAETFKDGRTSIAIKMPLRELMRNFFDELKSVSSGYASLSYEFESLRDADVTRMEILVADEVIEAFTRVVAQRRVEEEASKAVDRLEKVLPRQMFTTKIQAKANGRIIASRSLSALRKDVTGYLYGGDITRKMKLLEKQKKGKKKMLEHGKKNVNIPHDVFLKMMKTGE